MLHLSFRCGACIAEFEQVKWLNAVDSTIYNNHHRKTEKANFLYICKCVNYQTVYISFLRHYNPTQIQDFF